MAILYNDQSVLENYHIATTYRILKMDGCDFTKGSKIDRRRMRKLMTHLILHTDMAYHTRVVDQIQVLKKTKIMSEDEMAPPKGHLKERKSKKRWKMAVKRISLGKNFLGMRGGNSPRRQSKLVRPKQGLGAVSETVALSLPVSLTVEEEKDDEDDAPQGFSRMMSIFDGADDGFEEEKKEQRDEVQKEEWNESDKYDFLSALMHACDVSNLCKEKSLMLHWSQVLYVEFYAQGDRERELGLEVSEICDRNNPKRAGASIGFATFIVKPLFEGLKPFFKVCDQALSLLTQNTVYWKEKVAAENKKP